MLTDATEVIWHQMGVKIHKFECTVKECCIPEDWKSSVVLPIYKGKGDPVECGSHRGIKLLEHAMKVVERIFEYKIQQEIDIDDYAAWIYERQGITQAIFTHAMLH